jgi:outer membrane murein-binding lipoprotein Lpp
MLQLALAASAFVLLSGCASQGEELQSIDEAAQAACEAEHVAPGPAMNACIDQMRENIRAARAYSSEPPPPPPSRPSGNSGSSRPPR